MASEIAPVEFKLMQLINQKRQLEFKVSSILCRVAENHAEQLFAAQFSNAAGEGIESLSMEEAGYRAEAGAYASAAIGFSNYLGSDAAAKALSSALEADANAKGFSLYAEGFSEAGIHVFAGSLYTKGSQLNVYMAVVYCARPVNGLTEDRVSEVKLFHLLNQFRSAPYEVLSAMEMDTEGMDESRWLPALCKEDSLEDIQTSYVYEMTGVDPNGFVNTVYSKLLGALSGRETLLDESVTGVKINIDTKWVEKNNQYLVEYTANLSWGRETLPEPQILGLVFNDTDSNGLYDLGEEKPYVPMVIYDAGIHTRTDAAGGIYETGLSDEKGYSIILFPPGQPISIYQAEEVNHKFLMIDISE